MRIILSEREREAKGWDSEREILMSCWLHFMRCFLSFYAWLWSQTGLWWSTSHGIWCDLILIARSRLLHHHQLGAKLLVCPSNENHMSNQLFGHITSQALPSWTSTCKLECQSDFLSVLKVRQLLGVKGELRTHKFSHNFSRGKMSTMSLCALGGSKWSSPWDCSIEIMGWCGCFVTLWHRFSSSSSSMRRRVSIDHGPHGPFPSASVSSSSTNQDGKRKTSSVKTRKQLEMEEFQAGSQMSQEDAFKTWLHLERNIKEILTTHQATDGFASLYRWVYRLAYNRWEAVCSHGLLIHNIDSMSDRSMPPFPGYLNYRNGDVLYRKTKEALRLHVVEQLAPRLLQKFQNAKANSNIMYDIVEEWDACKKGFFMVRDINLYLVSCLSTSHVIVRIHAAHY